MLILLKRQTTLTKKGFEILDAGLRNRSFLEVGAKCKGSSLSDVTKIENRIGFWVLEIPEERIEDLNELFEVDKEFYTWKEVTEKEAIKIVGNLEV